MKSVAPQSCKTKQNKQTKEIEIYIEEPIHSTEHLLKNLLHSFQIKLKYSKAII